MIHCINISLCLSKKQKCFSKEKTVLRSVCAKPSPSSTGLGTVLGFLREKEAPCSHVQRHGGVRHF